MGFEIRIAKNRVQWYWVLIAKNGETLCTSETFNSKQACRKGIRSAKINAVFASTTDMSV